MLKDEIYRAYAEMEPDEAAKERMLKNIRSAALRRKFMEKEKRKDMRKRGTKAGLRLAAGVAVAVLAIGTAAYAVYYFSLKDTGTGKEEVLDLSEPFEETEYKTMEEIPLKEVDMISLAGVEGSPEHEADVEWQAFLDSYDQDGSVLDAVGDGLTGFEEEYGEYQCYSQEMADKIDEICEKYGLQKLKGFTLPENYEGLCEGAGVGDFLKGTAEDAKAEYIAGWFYADGSFDYDGNAVIGDSSPVTTDYQFSRAVKGTFQGPGLNVGDLEEYKEWNYTTKNGETVLLATNGSTKALIIAEREKSFVTVNVLGDIWGGTFGIGEEELEKLAEAFDFSVIP